jgi:hypothetical protein
MERKNLRRTEGSPLYFGIASAVLILIYRILSSGVSIAYAREKLSPKGIIYDLNPAQNVVGIIVNYIIYPGIFLVLLLQGADKPKRGFAFPIVWAVFSCFSILLIIVKMFQADLRDFANQMIPDGFYPYILLDLLGSICMLVSCVLMLQRLHEPEQLTADKNMAVSQN